MMKRKWIPTSLIILSQIVLPSPQDRLEGAGGGIQGLVIEQRTGQPIEGVRISVVPESRKGLLSRAEDAFGIDEPRRLLAPVFTDSQGRFQMTGLAPGAYDVHVLKEGFFREAAYSSSVRLTLVAGQQLEGLKYQLAATPTITGRVLDGEGYPVPSAVVLAVKTEYLDGRRVIIPPGLRFQQVDAFREGGPNGEYVGLRSRADELGAYRLYNLEPGSYYVAVWGAGFDEGSLRPAQYYPGTAQPENAIPVTVSSGVDAAGIDIRLTPQEAYQVRFKTVVPTSPPYDCSGVASSYRTESFILVRQSPSLEIVQFFAQGLREQPGGLVVQNTNADTWLTPALPPGSYELYYQWCSVRSGLVSRLGFDVADRDVDAGSLVIEPNVSLAGVVKNASRVPVPLSELQVRLIAADGRRYGMRAALPSRVNAEGRFSFDSRQGIASVARGLYYVDISGLPPEVYVESIYYRGVAVRDSQLRVVAGDGPLEITLAGPGGAVGGIVRNAQDNAVSEASVVLIPELSRRMDLSAFRSVKSDQMGAFEIRGIPPGRYRILAWEEIEAGIWKNASFLETVTAPGRSLQSRPGSLENVVLRVIPNDR